MKVEVFTDGSATTKDKPGGYGWVIVVDDKFHSEGSGSIPNATNNDAELEAAIKGLANAYNVAINAPIEILGKLDPVQFLPEVTLVSDSQIILGWVSGAYRFKQESKIQKYQAIQRLKSMMYIKTRWVEGHTGVEWNERCDKLAGIERDKAMGVTRKPRTDSKKLKEACKKMSDTLEWIKREMLQMEAEGTYVRHDIEDKCDEALEFYREKVK